MLEKTFVRMLDRIFVRNVGKTFVQMLYKFLGSNVKITLFKCLITFLNRVFFIPLPLVSMQEETCGMSER
jgi:hypothetical protein